MFNLTAGFSTRKCKWAGSAQGEANPISKVPGGKC